MSFLVVPNGSKPHKAVSTDVSRPLLCSALLRKREDVWELVTTNSYECAIVKLEVVKDDRQEPVPGLISRRALRAIVHAGNGFHTTEDTVRVLDSMGKATGDLFDRPKSDQAFPDVDRLFTEDPPAARVAFSLRQLTKLAAGLGTDVVELEVDPNPLKVIRVRSLTSEDHRGLLMPIRSRPTPKAEAGPEKKPRGKKRKR